MKLLFFVPSLLFFISSLNECHHRRHDITSREKHCRVLRDKIRHNQNNGHFLYAGTQSIHQNGRQLYLYTIQSSDVDLLYASFLHLFFSCVHVTSRHLSFL
jgi:hypothetical protein